MMYRSMQRFWIPWWSLLLMWTLNQVGNEMISKRQKAKHETLFCEIISSFTCLTVHIDRGFELGWPKTSMLLYIPAGKKCSLGSGGFCWFPLTQLLLSVSTTHNPTCSTGLTSGDCILFPDAWAPSQRQDDDLFSRKRERTVTFLIMFCWC